MATRKTGNLTAVGRIMIILCLIIALSLAAATKLGYTREGEYVIERVEKFRNVKTDYTELKYYVYTDQGMFQIELEGLNAYPYGVTLLSSDLPKKVRMKTRGARVEWYGMYPNIIEVVEEEQEW